MNRVVFITGASSGIGNATAKKFIKNGDLVYGMARKDFVLNGGVALKGDVTNPSDIENALNFIISKHNRVDIIINNAGMGISGPVEVAKPEDIKKQFDVNFFGAVNVTQAFLPYLRKSKGYIINVSSIMAFIPLHFQSFYSASKGALDNFSLALRQEVKPYGIKVCNIQPGDVKTGFTDSRIKNNIDTIYNSSEKDSTKKFEKSERKGMSPDKIANKIYNISKRKNPPITCTVGFSYKLIKFLVRFLPQKFVSFIASKLF